MASDTAAVLHDAIAGDGRAFDALIGPFIDPGFKLAMSMLNSREEAEEALQEATIRAWRDLRRLKDAQLVRSWFLTMVANQCRPLLRGRSSPVVEMAEPERRQAGPEEEAAPPTDLQVALRSLPPDARLALYLRYYLDLPLAEVAPILGISEPAARSRIQRAAQALRPAVDVPEVLS